MPVRNDEFEELLSKSDKDLEYSSPFDNLPPPKRLMDHQTRPLSKWTIPLVAGLLFMTMVVIGLTITLVNREPQEAEHEPAVAVSPSRPPYSSVFLAQTPEPEDGLDVWKRSRLASNVQPIRYRILLHPNTTTNRFEGSCRVWVRVTAPTGHIVLHSNGLNVTSWSVFAGDNDTNALQQVAVSHTFNYPENEYWVMALDKAIETNGTYQLVLKFSGVMADLVGLYRSTYKNSDGEERYLAVTKFEPTDARRAFPCFDEPHMKAIFEMTVVHEPQYIALSNMPIKESKSNKDGFKETEFLPSVPMSTYLVCIIVCDFNFTSRKTKDGIDVRVYAAPSQINSTNYAVDAAVTILDFYSEYFGMPYPLPKQDLIAIPDFMSGAMENWGLITFRETALLYNPSESSDYDKESVLETVAHELGHMWFGNLVTMKWWDDIWLNEGFARYLEQLGCDQVEKEWRKHESFIVDETQLVMVEDSGSHSHPIVQPVIKPQDINQMFDHISYNKGSAVIYMLNAVMGSDRFRAGLNNYLKRYNFSNAVTANLWDELAKASLPKLDVLTMMDTWTRQEGFPVIEVHRNPGNDNQLSVSQRRFFMMPNDSLNVDRKSSIYGFLWEVPLTYMDPVSGLLKIHWLHREEKNALNLNSIGRKPLKFNVNNTGYYRVNYEVDVWQIFAEQLAKNHLSFSRPDRVNLLDDVFALSKGGYVSYAIALQMAKYLKDEEDYLPWETAITHLQSIALRLEATDVYPLIRNFTLNLLTPIYEKLGWNDEGDWHSRRLRVSVLGAACKLGHTDCLTNAVQRFDDWKSGRKNVSQNLKTLVYKYGIQSSYSMDDWDFVWSKYTDSRTSPSEKDKYLTALAATKEPSLIYKYIEYVKDPQKIRSQDFFRMLIRLATNRVAVNSVWDYVRTNWNNITQRYSLNNHELGQVFPYIASMFSDELRVKEMEEFIAKYPSIGAGQLQRQQALDAMQRNIEWLARCKQDIKLWLEGNLV